METATEPPALSPPAPALPPAGMQPASLPESNRQPAPELPASSLPAPAAPTPRGKHVAQRVGEAFAYVGATTLGVMEYNLQVRGAAYKNIAGTGAFDELQKGRGGRNEKKLAAWTSGAGETRRGWTSKLIEKVEIAYRENVKEVFEGHNLRNHRDYWRIMTPNQKSAARIQIATVFGIALAAGLVIAKSDSLKKIFTGRDSGDDNPPPRSR